MRIWDDTRDDWDARPGRAMYTEHATARTAFMVHHVGDSPLGLAAKPHSACLDAVKGFQDFHMGPSRGWSDLGYTGLVCQHGRAIEGRGLAFVGAHCPGYNRTGWGIQFMVGGGEDPTDAAKARMVRLDAQLSALAGRTLQELGHRDGYPTACPSDEIWEWVHAGMPLDRDGGAQSVELDVPQPRPTSGELVEDGIRGPATYRALQKVIGASPDGIWGPATRRALQRFLRVTVDGDIGPESVKALQAWVGATRDGIWGRRTTLALQKALNDDKQRPRGRVFKRKPKPKPRPQTSDVLQRGDEGKAVRRLQQGLNDVFPAYSRLTVDGIFGAKTAAVVREFQKRSRLAQDGVVGERTRAALARHGIKP